MITNKIALKDGIIGDIIDPYKHYNGVKPNNYQLIPVVDLITGYDINENEYDLYDNAWLKDIIIHSKSNPHHFFIKIDKGILDKCYLIKSVEETEYYPKKEPVAFIVSSDVFHDQEHRVYIVILDLQQEKMLPQLIDINRYIMFYLDQEGLPNPYKEANAEFRAERAAAKGRGETVSASPFDTYDNHYEIKV